MKKWAAHRAESVQDNSLSFHFTVVMAVLAKPEENRGRVRLYFVDQSCQRMFVIKALLSVLLSAPTQRSLSDDIALWLNSCLLKMINNLKTSIERQFFSFHFSL